MVIIENKRSKLIESVNELVRLNELDDRQAAFVVMQLIEEMQAKCLFMEVDIVLHSLFVSNAGYRCKLGALRCTYKFREYYNNWNELNGSMELPIN